MAELTTGLVTVTWGNVRKLAVVFTVQTLFTETKTKVRVDMPMKTSPCNKYFRSILNLNRTLEMAEECGYRDSKGKFIPKHMKADKANDRGLGGKYWVSDNYKGKSENAVGTRLEPNPHEAKGNGKPHDAHRKTGNKPDKVPVKEKFSK